MGWVDHWNTDNPHVDILIRGRADDGKDQVISRAYISQGFRERAAERDTLDLVHVPNRTSARPWKGADAEPVDRSRPGEDPELRRLMIARAAKLERLGVAEQAVLACRTVKSGP